MPDEDLPARARKFAEALLRAGINGFGPLKSARESADDARRKYDSTDDAIKHLIRNHVTLAATQGFVTNLGGFATLPVALPTNVGAAFLIQTHLAAAIAHLKGHDLEDEEVRTAILVCLLGNSAAELLKKAGIAIGEKLTLSAIKKLPITVLRRINQRVGFALLAKYGSKRAVVTLAKAVPAVGGIVGGGVDAAATRGVGAFARRFFADLGPAGAAIAPAPA